MIPAVILARTPGRRKADSRTKRNAERTAAGLCYQCGVRPLEKGRRCLICAGKQAPSRPRSPDGPVTHERAPAGPSPVQLRLVRDDREGLFARRHTGCALLRACEEAWIGVYLGANIQARCPVRCAARSEGT